MNRRGLLGSLMSLVPVCFVSAKSSPDTNPPVGLIDKNGRYLTCPPHWTPVWLVARPGIWSNRGGEGGTVLWGDQYNVVVGVDLFGREYRSNGQVRENIQCRVVNLKIEPMYANAEAAMNHKFEDAYPGDDTVISHESFYARFCDVEYWPL